MNLNTKFHSQESNPVGIGKELNLAQTSDFFASKSDEEIWEFFKSGHEGAFHYIYNTYLRELFQYGTHFTHDRETIKDAIHDLFIELRNSRNLAKTDSIKFYLLKALRWKIKRLLKKSSKYSDSPYPKDQFLGEVEISCEEKMINIQMSEAQLEKLGEGLKGLSKRQVEALYHFYYEDMSYTQVAKIMELANIKSARNLIYKSIDRLKVFFSSK